jgi:hypothetical protein
MPTRRGRWRDFPMFPTAYYEGTALYVDVASARFLLAMKLFAFRVESDADDVAFLYRQVGLLPSRRGSSW